MALFGKLLLKFLRLLGRKTHILYEYSHFIYSQNEFLLHGKMLINLNCKISFVSCMAFLKARNKKQQLKSNMKHIFVLKPIK